MVFLCGHAKRQRDVCWSYSVSVVSDRFLSLSKRETEQVGDIMRNMKGEQRSGDSVRTDGLIVTGQRQNTSRLL